MENNLPLGWIECPLGEIAQWSSGGTPSRKIQSYFGGHIPWIKTGELNDNYIYHTEEHLTEEGVVNSSAKIFPKGSVAIAMYGATIGKTAILGIDASSNQACAIAQVNPDILLNKYLFYYLRSQKQAFIDKGQGGAQPNISQQLIKEHTIPLAPVNEQHRIVDKLDKLLQKIEASRERLEKIPGILKRFRQAVLAAAVSGKLTEDWRKAHPDIESGKALVKKVIKQRLDKYEIELKKFKIEGNKKPAIPKISEELIDAALLFEVPTSWTWTKLLNIAEVRGGVTKGRNLKGQRTFLVPYLRVANVQDGFLDLEEIKKIEVLEEDIEKYRLENGDILFTEGGDRDKLGRGTIWQNEIEGCIHQNHIFRARVASDNILPAYVSIFTKSKSARSYFFENASQTVNLASINLSTLSNVPIAVPPKEEQEEIVQQVESLLNKASKIELQYNKAKAYLDNSSLALLVKAFRGELVPQDSNDEPANNLLERIKKALSEKINLKEPKFSKIKDNLILMAEPKSLIDTIRQQFSSKAFTFDDLRNHVDLPYENLKEEVFNLLEEKPKERLVMDFDKATKTMTFRISEHADSSA